GIRSKARNSPDLTGKHEWPRFTQKHIRNSVRGHMSERREQDAKEQGAAAAIERRAWVRFSCDMEASCRSAGAMKNAGWPGRIIDISTGGVGLLLKHRFRPGTLLLVELNNG